MTNLEIILNKTLKAAQKIIDYYNQEMERDFYEDEEVPEELREAEEHYNKCLKELEKHEGDI